ncbi:NfeD family protein [Enterocloster lavalensis]|uniref:NfeD family protein n=1 Tax=Enterocloster lavalensis TaxID=460384 RepID=UPI002A830034|nr:NfeD family protein [Enterocloster lavalensis]
MVVIYWMIAFLVFLGVEAATTSLASIWFAGGALAALAVAAVGLGVKAQLIVFVLVSFILLLLVRPLASGFMKGKDTKTNVDGLVGRKAVVKERVDNLAGTGTAVLGAETWLARSVVEGQIFEPGTVVEVAAISGAKLIVKA